MTNPNATAVVASAVTLTRCHPHAQALDVLDLVMKGRIDQVLDLTEPDAVNGGGAAPGMLFDRPLAGGV